MGVNFHSSMGSGVPVGADGEQESCRQKVRLVGAALYHQPCLKRLQKLKVFEASFLLRKMLDPRLTPPCSLFFRFAQIHESVLTSTKNVDSDRYSWCTLLNPSEMHDLNKSDADETDARCSETAWALGQHVLSTPMCSPHLPQNAQALPRPQSQKPDLKYTLESSVLLSLLPASKLEPNNVKSDNDAQAGCKVRGEGSSAART